MTQLLFIWMTAFLLYACQEGQGETTAPPAGSLTQGEPEAIQAREAAADSLADIPLAYLLGRFDPAKDSNFISIQSQHGVVSGYLHKETYEAFVRMYDAAKADGITLTIISATRNFDRQKWIWENKWKGGRKVAGKNLALEVPDTVERARLILTYSSMPGTSRHHWGTDMDLNKDNNGYFSTGEGLKVYQWLQSHAAEYGFCQPYTAKGPERPYGYEEEKWHWSYLPLARPYLASYLNKVNYDTLGGFLGAGTARSIEVIDRYVAGIATECQ